MVRPWSDGEICRGVPPPSTDLTMGQTEREVTKAYQPQFSRSQARTSECGLSILRDSLTSLACFAGPNGRHN